MAKPKTIITPEMLANMEMFAVTNPGMRDLLEQCKVLYELSGAPKYFEDEDEDEDEDEEYLQSPCVDLDSRSCDLSSVRVESVEIDSNGEEKWVTQDARKYFSNMWNKTK